MRLKEIGGRKGATLLMEEMPQGFSRGVKERAWQAVSESQCVGSVAAFLCSAVAAVGAAPGALHCAPWGPTEEILGSK